MPRTASRRAFVSGSATSGNDSDTASVVSLSSYTREDEEWIEEVFGRPVVSLELGPGPRLLPAAQPGPIDLLFSWCPNALVPSTALYQEDTSESAADNGADEPPPCPALPHPQQATALHDHELPGLSNPPCTQEQRIQIGHAPGGRAGAVAPPREPARSLATPASAQLAEPTPVGTHVHGLPDFIAESDDMKRVVTMALSDSEVSVRVHRVGDSLFLDGELPSPPNSYPPPLQPTASAPGSGRPRLPRSGDRHAGPDDALSLTLSFGSVLSDDTLLSPSGMSSLKRRARALRLTPSVPAQPTADTDATAAPQRAPPLGAQRSTHPSCAPTPSAPRAAAVERRAFCWQLDNVSALLSSDVVMYTAGGDGPAAHMHLLPEHVSSEACLDLWLDNVLKNKESVALCCHSEGNIQGYHVVKTKDIPALAGIQEAATACLSTASAILQMLKENCQQDGASYVLHKDAASKVVRLYELQQAASPQTRPTKTRSRNSVVEVARDSAQREGQAGSAVERSDEDSTAEDDGCGPLSASKPDGDSGVVECDAPDACGGTGPRGTMKGSGAGATGTRAPEVRLESGAPGPDACAKRLAEPYRERVAVLCYRMACRLVEAGHGACTRASQLLAYRLLCRCAAFCSSEEQVGLAAAAQLRCADLCALSLPPSALWAAHGLRYTRARVPCLLALLQQTRGNVGEQEQDAGLQGQLTAVPGRKSIGSTASRAEGDGQDGAGARSASDATGNSCVAGSEHSAWHKASQHCAAGLALLEAHGPLEHLDTWNVLLRCMVEIHTRRALWEVEAGHVGAALRCVELAHGYLGPCNLSRRESCETRIRLHWAAGQAYMCWAATLQGLDSAATAAQLAQEQACVLGASDSSPRCFTGDVPSLATPSAKPAHLWELSQDRHQTYDHAVKNFLSALKLFGAKGEQDAECMFQRVALELAAAYSSITSLLLHEGRFTRALQHSKQGVIVFEGVQASVGVAVCYACMGTLFTLKNRALDDTTPATLVERERNTRESLRHFDMALQACEGSKLPLSAALKLHIEIEVAAVCHHCADGLLQTMPLCKCVKDVTHLARTMLHRALDIYQRTLQPHSGIPALGSPGGAAPAAHIMLLVQSWAPGDGQAGLQRLADVHTALLRLVSLQLATMHDSADASHVSQLVSIGTKHGKKALSYLSAASAAAKRLRVRIALSRLFQHAAQACTDAGSQAKYLEQGIGHGLQHAGDRDGDAARDPAVQSALHDLFKLLQMELKLWLKVMLSVRSSTADQKAAGKELYRLSLMDPAVEEDVAAVMEKLRQFAHDAQCLPW